VGVEEGGVLGGEDHVGLAQEVERPSAGHAVDGGDHRLPEALALGAEQLARVLVGEHVVAELDLGAVDPGAERLLARTGEHDGPHVVGGLGPLPHRGELVDHGRVERVVDLGPVQRDGGDAVGDVEGEGGELGAVVCHGAGC